MHRLWMSLALLAKGGEEFLLGGCGRGEDDHDDERAHLVHERSTLATSALRVTTRHGASVGLRNRVHVGDTNCWPLPPAIAVGAVTRC